MLEYFDEKLGKIKLVNVTEARANFAKLLSDESHYYVITKNNKPQRVVISYEEFRELRQLAASGESVQTPTPKPKPKAEVEKTLAHQPYVKTPSRVKGLLAQHFQDPTENVLPEVPVSKPVPQIPNTWETDVLTENTDDYFQISDEYSVHAEEQDLINPEEIFETQQTAEDMQAQEDVAVLEDLSQSLSITDELTSVDFAEAEPVEEEAPVASKTKELARTSEEEEYYNKYRKLYESVPEREPEPSFEPQIIFENRKQREVKTIVDSLPELNVGADEVARHFRGEKKTVEPVFEPAPKVEVQQAKPQKVDLGMSQSLMDEKSDLPSLQELLRGLESDNAVDEDLSEGEIDSIVKQIRHEE